MKYKNVLVPTPDGAQVTLELPPVMTGNWAQLLMQMTDEASICRVRYWAECAVFVARHLAARISMVREASTLAGFRCKNCYGRVHGRLATGFNTSHRTSPLRNRHAEEHRHTTSWIRLLPRTGLPHSSRD